MSTTSAGAPAPLSSPEADAANDWDDETEVQEAAAQAERDRRHNPNAEFEAEAQAQQGDAIVPIEAPRQARRQPSTEDEDDSSTSTSSDSDDAEEESLLSAAKAAVTATQRVSPPLHRFTPAAAVLPQPAAVVAGPSSMLQDAMANPPPPAISAAASPRNGNGKRHSPGNVITLTFKRDSDEARRIKSEPIEEETDDDDAQMDDASETHAKEESDAEDEDAFKIEDLESAMDDEPQQPAASPAIKAEVKVESPAPAPVSNKIKLTIPRSAKRATPHAAAAPTITPSPRAVPSASPPVADPALPVPPAATAAALRVSSGIVIPPTSGITPHGRAVLERYRRHFFDRAEPWAPLPMTYYSGREITDRWIAQCGLRSPFIATNATELGLKIPPSADGSTLTVRDVVTALPPNHELSVIDVATQSESSAWSLAQWLDYYETPKEERTAVCNVISLEISRTDFAKQNLASPKFVRDLDWMRLWPTEIKLPHPPALPSIEALAEHAPRRANHASPNSATAAVSSAAAAGTAPSYTQTIPTPVGVALYCLMGAAGSYTDFHADFGGSSVWYHVVRGEKIFLAVEPTAENLKLYEEWHEDGKALTTFLPDLYAKRDLADGRDRVKNPTVRMFSVKPGQTLFLPSGWIHAVYTPVDSLVFGGNFLHSYNIGSQLLIYNVELNTHIEARFKFPSFESLHWLWMREYVRRLREPLAQLRVTLFELHGLASLVKTAAWWMKQGLEGMKRGSDASRPRVGSKFESPTVPPPTTEESTEVLEMCWPLNIPFDWSEACRLLTELDLLITYNAYLIEREEYDDEMEMRREAKESGVNAADESESQATAATWSKREQLATKCFRQLQTLGTHSYECVEMVNPTTLPWLKKSARKKANRSAIDEEAEEVTEERVPLAPTTFGRTRHHNVKLGEFLSDAAFDDADESTTTGADAAPADATGSKKRNRRAAQLHSDEDEEFDLGSDAAADDGADSDEEFDGSSKPSRKKGKQQQQQSNASTARPAASRPPPAASNLTGLAAIRARAQAAAAAAGSGSAHKKILPADAPVKRGKAGAAKAAPQQSAKQRIMARLGLSGKLR